MCALAGVSWLASFPARRDEPGVHPVLSLAVVKGFHATFLTTPDRDGRAERHQMLVINGHFRNGRLWGPWGGLGPSKDAPGSPTGSGSVTQDPWEY